jgi:hypothetical protein
MTIRIATSPVIWIGVVAGVLTGAAAYIGGSGLWPAALGGSIPIAYGIAVTFLARRSAVSSVLAGRPVDERWEHIGLEATALTLGISAVVILGAFIVSLAIGGEWQPYAFAGAVMALAYLFSLIVVRMRH